MTVETWNRDPPPGFQGLREDVPLRFYLRHLPWRQDGATYFVTFRLADSLPHSKLRELESLRREFLVRHGITSEDWQAMSQARKGRAVAGHKGNAIPRQAWESFCRDQMERVEKWLDQGMGSCILKSPQCGQIVVETLHHFDNDAYELGCYVMMPNHVHAVIRPLRPETHPLEKILQGRKLRTALEINKALRRSGNLWQEESFDRIIRDGEHLYRCIQYIGDNPRRAGLSLDDVRLWVRPSWDVLGWGFEMKDGLLIRPAQEMQDGLLIRPVRTD